MIKEDRRRTKNEWKYKIGYQCFVDSFSIGSEDLGVKFSSINDKVYDKEVKLLEWDEEYDEYCYGYGYYGGDLIGVKKAAENYLSGFGINLLYLTPIFSAESNHKYDSLNYKEIDKRFGTIGNFKELVKICSDKGISLILDGVFNHTSSNHEWFKKAKLGDKIYSDFYKKNNEGYYLNWGGVETMPLLNHDNSSVQKYFYLDNDSVVPFWLNLGAGGWRLDVAEGLGKEVILKIKKSISSRFNDKILYGEVVDSYGREWLGEDLLDGVMNYVFLGNVVNFLTNKINGEKLLFELSKMYNEYPVENLMMSWNIISTHDTNRMIYEVGGDENLFKIAVALQFTYPGVPMIYYGDELGITPGKKDYNNRKGMDWEKVNILDLKLKAPWKIVQPMDWKRANELGSFNFYYKHMIWLRKNYQALVEGEFLPVFSNEDIIAFFRIYDDKFIFTLVNRGRQQKIKINIPKEIYKLKPALKGLHGPLSSLDCSKPTIEICAYAQNSYILAN